MQSNEMNVVSGPAGRRSIILALLIVALTFFWVLILFYTNLPIAALASVAVPSILLLAVATAWTAMAFPSRGGSDSK